MAGGSACASVTGCTSGLFRKDRSSCRSTRMFSSSSAPPAAPSPPLPPNARTCNRGRSGVCRALGAGEGTWSDAAEPAGVAGAWGGTAARSELPLARGCAVAGRCGDCWRAAPAAPRGRVGDGDGRGPPGTSAAEGSGETGAPTASGPSASGRNETAAGVAAATALPEPACGCGEVAAAAGERARPSLLRGAVTRGAALMGRAGGARCPGGGVKAAAVAWSPFESGGGGGVGKANTK